jgi:hypothetical protein
VSHVSKVWTMSAMLTASLVATMAVSAAPEPAPMNVYFGSLGAYPFNTGQPGGFRADFEVARAVDQMDFLTIATRMSSAKLRGSAAAMNAAFDGRFVAMWSWQYGAPSHGNYVNVLELSDLDDGTVPYGRYDLFFRTWLPRHGDVTSNAPIVQFPQPRDMAVDYGLIDMESPEALATVVAPYVRTIEITTAQSSAAASGHALDTGDWAPYLNYLNVGLRIAPTADVERTARTGDVVHERRTAVVAKQLRKADILEGIRERRVYASEDRNLRISFSINSQPMGSIVSMAPETPLRIEVTFSDPDEPKAQYWLSLRRDVPGGALDASRELFGTDYSGDGRVVFTQFRRSSRDEYFLLRILQEGNQGIDSVWTAPIWLTTSPKP